VGEAHILPDREDYWIDSGWRVAVCVKFTAANMYQARCGELQRITRDLDPLGTAGHTVLGRDAGQTFWYGMRADWD